MNDAAVLALARQAGINVQWTDYAGKQHRVSLDAVRAILAALGSPCATREDLSESRRKFLAADLQPLITATVQQRILLSRNGLSLPRHGRLIEENGTTYDIRLDQAGRHVYLPAIDTAGYHTLDLGSQSIMLAVAPKRCTTVDDLVGHKRLWGLVAQIYGLRSHGDYGIGDASGVTALAKASTRQKADAIAISPTHALFTADPAHCSPYSPSTRLFLNPLHASAGMVFGDMALAKASAATGASPANFSLIDWPEAARAKLKMFRALFEDFAANERPAESRNGLAAEFAKFRAAGGLALERHGLFEALHAARLRDDPQAWSWRNWPDRWRRMESPDLKDFARANQREITFHIFLQWVAAKSFAEAQRFARDAGMRIGLIADIAVGINPSGGEAWADPASVLGALEIGAPPDLFNTHGQNWGLTTFDPRALARTGYRHFINTLRASMRHAGGIRIDHAMGLMRLWLVPHGAKPSEGAYLSYPLVDLLRLIALESQRHRAIVVGEDLGTVPEGFRDKLGRAGIYGMSVLWFEREKYGFRRPDRWPRGAVAMTSTHDLPTVAGWWRGSDLTTRATFGLLRGNENRERRERARDRIALWKALKSAKIESGKPPTQRQTTRVVDAAIKYIGQTPSALALIPMEDALALLPQPNLPGTIDQHPNWRRRYRGEAGALLDSRAVRKRLAPLANRDP